MASRFSSTHTTYACDLCGHPYGQRLPAAPKVQLHLAVSHPDYRPNPLEW